MTGARRVAAAVALLVVVVVAAPAGGATLAVQTVAGTGVPGVGRAGALASAAPLRDPRAVDVSAGTVFVADTGNNRVWRIGADGRLAAVAGTGAASSDGDGGRAVDAGVLAPSALDVTDDGRVLIAEPYRIRSVAPDGSIATLAGSGIPGDRGDGGAAGLARFDNIAAVAARADGSVLVADRVNRRVRSVDADGVVRTVAGSGSPGSTGDGGPATAAALVAPSALAITPDGGYLIGDAGSGRVRRVEPSGRIVTIAGGGTGAPAVGRRATDVELVPVGLANLPDGDLAIASAGREEDNLPAAVVVVGKDGAVLAVVPAGACGLNALCAPSGLAADGAAILAADPGSHTVARIADGGSALAPAPRPTTPAGGRRLALRGVAATRHGATLRVTFMAPAGTVRVDALVHGRWRVLRRARTRGGRARLVLRLPRAARRSAQVRVVLRRGTSRAVATTRVRRR